MQRGKNNNNDIQKSSADLIWSYHLASLLYLVKGNESPRHRCLDESSRTVTTTNQGPVMTRSHRSTWRVGSGELQVAQRNTVKKSLKIVLLITVWNMIKLKVSVNYWNFYFLLSKCLVLSHLNWAVWSLKPGVNLIFFRSILTSWATPNFPKNSLAFFSCPNSSINPSPISSWIKLASWDQCRLNMIKPLVIYINFWRLDDPPRIDEEILCARELDLDYQTCGISTVKKSLDLDITDHYNKGPCIGKCDYISHSRLHHFQTLIVSVPCTFLLHLGPLPKCYLRLARHLEPSHPNRRDRFPWELAMSLRVESITASSGSCRQQRRSSPFVGGWLLVGSGRWSH